MTIMTVSHDAQHLPRLRHSDEHCPEHAYHQVKRDGRNDVVKAPQSSVIRRSDVRTFAWIVSAPSSMWASHAMCDKNVITESHDLKINNDVQCTQTTQSTTFYVNFTYE